MKLKPSRTTDLINALKKIDETLCKANKKLEVTVLGGASILLLGIKDRVTADIDVAATKDATHFQKICKELGINVDIITVSSTVDLVHYNITNVFRGKALTVNSVVPKDLLKLKLERFYKQDPEDIYAIIKHENLSFAEFKSIVKSMLPDYIGNVRQLIISAQIVVEQIWPDHTDDFQSGETSLNYEE